MDRALPDSERRRRARSRRWTLIVVAAVLLLGLGALRSCLRPGVDRDALRTARVERGDVVAGISAAGQVVPMEEQVVSALFDSEVVEVIASPGDPVEEGEPILRLDGRSLELELADLGEQLALEENQRRGERVALEETLDGYRSRLELLAIDLQSREARESRYETLARDGAISADQLFEAELDVTRTSVEIAQLERAMKHAEASAATELERIDLETSILRHRREEAERRLAAAMVRAPRDGVVTWALEEIGTRVGPGMALARVADLSAFRVEAQISDFYANRLESGLPATVTVGGEKVDASVAAILPTVEGGQMTLQVDLADPRREGLRPRLRVDVEVITGRVHDALGLKNGPAIGSEGRQWVYRIVDGVAERTEVRFGISSRHRVEVLEGLEEGDEVILSDTRDFQHLERIRVE